MASSYSECKRVKERGSTKEEEVEKVRMNDFRNKNLFEPEEILVYVLTKLPIKSLLICKSVCKYWRSLICSPTFKRWHLIQSQETRSYIVHHYRPGNQIQLLTKIDRETTQILPSCFRFYFEGMVCSFNGLVCCIKHHTRHVCKCDHVDIRGMKKLSITICNPATQQFLLLPPASASDCPNHHNLCTVGVSYHSTINEYKVFQFFFSKQRPYECMVYSSITGSWKSLATSTVDHLESSNKHVCINGTVYWLCRSILDGWLVAHILAVDWEEKFSIIRIPEEETMNGILANLEGCLSIVVVDEDRPFRHRFDIWVLKDSKKSIWVKKFSDYMSFSTRDQILWVDVQINEILFGTRKQYALYNMHTRSRRVFNWAFGPYWSFSFSIAYAESFLPCKYYLSVFFNISFYLIPSNNLDLNLYF